MSFRFIILAGLLGASSASASHQSSPNENGCWDGRKASSAGCLAIRSHKWEDGRIIVTYENQCNKRIFTKVCHTTKSGSRLCSSFGIKGNSTRRYYGESATGTVDYTNTGSIDEVNDWQCALRANLKT